MTEKELRRLLGKEYDSAIKETMSTLTLPITKEKLIAALLKANKLYWVRRLSQIDTFFTADAEACAAALAVPYIAASKTFTDRVKSIYTAYESAFDLSHEDAKELLNKVVYDRSIAESLRKIADDMPDGKEKTRILAEISAPAYRYRLERAEAMCKQAQEVCDEIAVGEVSAVREFLQTETERAYNLTVEGLTEPTPADTIIESIAPEPIQLRFNEMPKASEPVRELTPTPVQTGVHDSFTLVSEKNVREIVEHDWNGREFSKSIWNHTDDLAKEIKQVLIEGELTGASEVDMAAKIAERFDVAMGRARCVVRTESNYCTNQAELKALKGAGIEFYEYAALHDERTSEICDGLNGKTFPLKDAVVGVNYPPMHPNCRSSVMPVLQTEDDLDRELEEMMRQAGAPEGMTFDEFVEHLEPSEDGERLEYKAEQNSTLNSAEESAKENSGNSENNGELEQIRAEQGEKAGRSDVTDEYLENATPGVGTLSYDSECTKDEVALEKYQDELDFAEWIHNTLGGDIHVNAEDDHTNNIKFPDYLWRGKLWDLKTPESENGANGRVKDGIEQIKNNCGGIMINYKDKDINYNKLEQILDKRMHWYKDITVDIMVVNKGDFVVYRYKK